MRLDLILIFDSRKLVSVVMKIRELINCVYYNAECSNQDFVDLNLKCLSSKVR